MKGKHEVSGFSASVPFGFFFYVFQIEEGRDRVSKIILRLPGMTRSRTKDYTNYTPSDPIPQMSHSTLRNMP